MFNYIMQTSVRVRVRPRAHAYVNVKDYSSELVFNVSLSSFRNA